jgi:hypothetical protein
MKRESQPIMTLAYLFLALPLAGCVPVAVGLGVGAGAAVGAYEVNQHLPAKK